MINIFFFPGGAPTTFKRCLLVKCQEEFERADRFDQVFFSFFIRIHIHIHIHPGLFICIVLHVCVCVHECVRVYVCMCVYVCASEHVCTGVSPSWYVCARSYTLAHPRVCISPQLLNPKPETLNPEP